MDEHALTKAVARYHAQCLRVIGAQNVALRDVRTTVKTALCCDVGVMTTTEQVMHVGRTVIQAPAKPTVGAMAERPRAYDQQLVIWERLRALAAKAAVDAHAKEVIYGSPLLQGYIAKKPRGRPEPVLAPLLMQSVTVTVTSSGEIEVNATDEPPRFNVAIWHDAVSTGDLDQIVTLGIDAQADLARGYDPERINRLLTGIASILPAVTPAEPVTTMQPWPEALAARERPSEPQLALHNGGVLFLANRSSPYLLADLLKIGQQPEAVLRKDTPLQVLMSEPDTTPRPEPVSPNLDEVVFPFPSNAAQRKVADALDKNRVVVVQGPPGNGKSQTIANLVAHLVAQGKSVLVTSHKTQALTVVRDLLAKTEQKFLFASLTGEGAEAKRELQRQIADVKAFAGAANRSKLELQMNMIDQGRRENGERYRRLRQEWIDRAEGEQQEAAEHFEDIVDVALLDARDAAIAPEARVAVASALRHLNHLSRQHASVWAELVIATNAGQDLDRATRMLEEFLDQQRARLTAATDPEVRAFVQAWHPVADAAPTQLDAALVAVDGIRHALASLLGRASHDGRVEGMALAQAPSLAKDVAANIEALEEAFTSARGLAEHRDAVASEPQRRSQVLQHHANLTSLVKRRGSRRWLDDHAPGAAGLTADAVKHWADFWEAWSRVMTLADGLAGGLRAELPRRFDPDAAQAVIARAKRAREWADAAAAAQAAAARTRMPLPLDAMVAAADLPALNAVLLVVNRALAALDADRSGNAIKDDPALGFLAGRPADVDALIDAADYSKAERVIADLDLWLQALPAVRDRHQLLAGSLRDLPHSCDALERAASRRQEAPPWLPSVERALEVHPALLRFREIALAPDTQEIAHDLSGFTDQVLNDARSLLGGRIKQRILDGFRKPSFLSSLEVFRKAIGSSPKRFERFEELKSSSSFDIDVLTDVFPCWVMRPEDACRVFPLRPGIFDVVVFDEASQCNPDQVLPLFARADRAIVVGDDRQLSNDDLRRSLSGDTNRTLIKQAHLDHLDPTGMFDQTRHSLLDLASRRQQAEILLNEHFRCRPEIIAFSNKEFYGETLDIIRDREDDRGLGPALIVRQALRSDGEPITTTGKVNDVEADALVTDLKRRLEDPRYDGMTFGVLSLFREQIEHLAVRIEREVAEEVREGRRIICSTVDGFQGDERDVILYSWRYASGDHPAVFAFTNGSAGEQRVNVALTRARHQSIHFISVPVDDFPASARNITGFLRHAIDPEKLLSASEAKVHAEPGGRARNIVRERLLDAGMRVTDDYVACGVSVDLLVRDPSDGKRLAVFVDADRAEYRPVDIPERVDQHSLLERAGWTVCRLPATSVLTDPDKVLDLVRANLHFAPTSKNATQPEEIIDYVTVDTQGGIGLDDPVPTLGITPEDRADYHWDVPSVPQRLGAGEPVFRSQFEIDLHDALARQDGIKVIPQWPTRTEIITLVVTDIAGRRIAVETDNHEPEDQERQALLEEAGWSFCRVAHRDFLADPRREVDRVLRALADRPADSKLAERVWTDQTVLEILDESAAMTNPAFGAPDA